MSTHTVDTLAAESGDLMRRARRYLQQWQHVPDPNVAHTSGDSSPGLVQALALHIEKLDSRVAANDKAARTLAEFPNVDDQRAVCKWWYSRARFVVKQPKPNGGK